MDLNDQKIINYQIFIQYKTSIITIYASNIYNLCEISAITSKQNLLLYSQKYLPPEEALVFTNSNIDSLLIFQ